MYMEFLKWSCENEKSERCEYCVSNDFCCYADIKQRPGLHYLATKDTPTVARSVDDSPPRVQLPEDNFFFDNPDNITYFLQKRRDWRRHQGVCQSHETSIFKERKRIKRKLEQREEARKTYKDYDWEGMLHERSLSQLKVRFAQRNNDDVFLIGIMK